MNRSCLMELIAILTVITAIHLGVEDRLFASASEEGSRKTPAAIRYLRIIRFHRSRFPGFHIHRFQRLRRAPLPRSAAPLKGPPRVKVRPKRRQAIPSSRRRRRRRQPLRVRHQQLLVRAVRARRRKRVCCSFSIIRPKISIPLRRDPLYRRLGI